MACYVVPELSIMEDICLVAKEGSRDEVEDLGQQERFTCWESR